jgi:ribosomal protein S18 acetylase RimI-like enzyme
VSTSRKKKPKRGLRLVSYDECDWSKAHEFSDLINEHDVQVTGEDPERWYSVFLLNARGKTVGGAAGLTSWGLCEVSALAVAPEHRGKGWGRRLVQAVEKLAARRGCTHVHLHSMNFQAVGFYRKLGYRKMAELVGRRGVYTRFFLSKALA